MGIRGIDISNHQGNNGLDVERVVRDNGLDFVFVLANDGTFRNVHFADQVAAARRGGALVAAYVYLRPNWQQTLDTFRPIVPLDIPVIVDVEAGSGGIRECRAIHDGLWKSGYHTPLLYWPKFYWEQVGCPDLSGLPPLWKSWYPDKTPRGYDAGLQMVPSYVWSSYGGLDVKVIQFTGTGRLSGYGANLDLNYFPGTRDELAALLGGSTTTEDDVTPLQDEMLRNLQFGAENKYELGRVGKVIAETGDIVKAMQAQLAGLTAAVSALSSNADLTVDEVRNIVTAAVKDSVRITGTVEITGAGA